MGFIGTSSQGEQIVLGVFGMACKHCEATVRSVLEDLDAIRSVTILRAEDEVRVQADPGTQPAPMLQAIREVGYEARIRSASP